MSPIIISPIVLGLYPLGYVSRVSIPSDVFLTY